MEGKQREKEARKAAVGLKPQSGGDLSQISIPYLER